MCNNKDTCDNCISDILKVILLLQQSVCQNDCCLETCDKGYLGKTCTTGYNTRPITLYTCSNSAKPLEIPISKDPKEEVTSNIFRLEKLDDCCATCRVLIKNTEPNPMIPYIATNSFFTINLNCVCIIRCLEDTYVDCI